MIVLWCGPHRHRCRYERSTGHLVFLCPRSIAFWESDSKRGKKNRALGEFGMPEGSSLTLRTLTVCGLAELALKFFPESFWCPRGAITPDHSSGPLESVALGGVIADADNHVPMERTRRRGTVVSSA
jgi:hypothetical protein